MIDFTLNNDPIDFYLNAETDGIAPPPTGDILMGDTVVLWGSTTVTFED